jgi:hypothetical protein
VSRPQAKVVQVNLDQALGSLAGAVVNAVAANLAASKTSPAEAAASIQRAWRRAVSWQERQTWKLNP